MPFSFLEVPRSFGNPRQFIDPKTNNPVVYDKDQLIKLIKENNGKNDCFISHQRFLSFLDRRPFEVEISKLFFDFDDTDPSLINAFSDLKKVMKFFNKNNIPYLPVFSGLKGMHLYVPLNPTNHINSSYLKKMYRSIMLHLKNELRLSTIDPSVATPTKLSRVWYSIHPKSKKFCCPLPKDIIDKGIDAIFKYSMEKPKPWHTDILKDKNFFTIEEYINFFNIDLKDEKQGIEFATIGEKYTNPNNEYLRELLLFPCLYNSILDIDNAVHYARFICCLHLKRIGCDPAWVFRFFKSRQYMDTEFEETCKYQINTIFGSNYTFPSCQKIKENGLCIGPTCKYYRK